MTKWKRKHDVWRETPYNFMLLLFEYKDVLHKINRFLLFHKTLLHFEESHQARAPMLLRCYR